MRQALNYTADRNEINELLFQGTSEPMWATGPRSSAYFNPELDRLLHATT